MSQITALKAQKNAKRVNLFVDEEFITGISLDFVVSRGLLVGQKLSSKELEKLLNEALFEKLYSRCLHFLSFRPRSPNELERFLQKKIDNNSLHLKKIVSQVLTKLEKKELINQQSFAHWWVDQRLSFRPKGKMVLRQELRQKGIDKEIIDEVLSAVDEAKVVKDFYENKLKKKPFLSQDLKKLATYLQRRGFLWENIKPLIDEIKNKD